MYESGEIAESGDETGPLGGVGCNVGNLWILGEDDRISSLLSTRDSGWLATTAIVTVWYGVESPGPMSH